MSDMPSVDADFPGTAIEPATERWQWSATVDMGAVGGTVKGPGTIHTIDPANEYAGPTDIPEWSIRSILADALNSTHALVRIDDIQLLTARYSDLSFRVTFTIGGGGMLRADVSPRWSRDYNRS